MSNSERSSHSNRFLRAILRATGSLCLAIALSALPVTAESSPPRDREIKARLANDSSGTLRRVNYSPLSLRGGSKLTLISPQAWSPLAEQIRDVLEKTHEYYTTLFGEIPPISTAIRLMDEETFFIATGAPKWTNAMYYRNQIVIPLALNTEIDMDALRRAVKHEYTHAIIHALSSGRCPGWLDEGLAQWAEGSENPALQPALRDWVLRAGAVPLSILQGGFTKLDAKIVPAAYAQSLYSAYVVMNSFGFVPLRNYFDLLRKGEDRDEAFKRSFELSETSFEQRLGESLERWAKSPHKHRH
ncbi:MAG: hypothetical protein J0M12_15925 [Deltaproteobacteria bacterium]|nr:hypothetical protein [Deltaproteobacteria bacterium]